MKQFGTLTPRRRYNVHPTKWVWVVVLATGSFANPETEGTTIIKPSRFTDNPTDYVRKLGASLAINTRSTDPFCQPQDPDQKPIVKTTVAKNPRRIITAEPPVPLANIVEQLKITTIIPKEKRFLVGDRTLGVGDKVPIHYHNKLIPTEITEVSTAQIVFRNTETGELGVLDLNRMPPGMTRGTDGIPMPETPEANPPLEIAIPEAPNN